MEGTKEDQIATSIWLYNPIYQKRTHFGPYPGMEDVGFFSYFGPPPDLGTSYGSWWDEENNFGVLAPVVGTGTQLYSPASGKPLNYMGSCDSDMLDTIVGYKGKYNLLPSTGTGQACLTSADIYSSDVEFDKFYNPFSGEDITDEVRSMSTAKNTKKSATAKAEKPTQVDLKVPTMPNVGLPKFQSPNKDKHAKAGELPKGEASSSGEKKVPNPESSLKTKELKIPKMSEADFDDDDKLLAAVEAHLVEAGELEIEIKDAEEEQMGESMSTSEEQSMSLEDEEGGFCAPASVPAEAPSPDAGLPILTSDDDISMESAQDEFDFSHLSNASLSKRLQAAAASMEAGNKVNEKEVRALMARALPIARRAVAKQKAARAASESDESFMKFLEERASKGKSKREDGAIASLQRQVNELSSMMKRFLAKAEGEKLLEEENKEEVSAPSSESSPPASSVPPASSPSMESAPPPASEAPVSAPSGMEGLPPPVDSVPPVSMETDERAIEEIMNEPDEESAEGVHFEVLHSLDDLEKEGISASSVELPLYAKGSANPFRNVIINGEPVARIFLQDLSGGERVRAVFESDVYEESFVQASSLAAGGLRQTLSDQNARYFGQNVDHSELGRKALAEASAKAKKDLNAQLAVLTDRFTEALILASVGMDKNFWPEDNHLKDALWTALDQPAFKRVIASNEQRMSFIESVIEAGQLPHFKVVVAKAVELLNMSREAYNATKNAVENAGIMSPSASNVTASVDEGSKKTMIEVLAESALNSNEDSDAKAAQRALRRELGMVEE